MNRWPMVGRSEELAFLTDVISDPERSGVLVGGGAGVGKTRLVRHVIEGATGHHVELVMATVSARPLPLGTFAHLLPEDLGAIDRVDLLAVIGRHLVRRAEGKPVILAVDDAHLLDESSAALVHHIATTGTAVVLLTVRSGEAVPDAVSALHRNGIVSRLELQPISRGEFDELIERALDGLTERATLDRMWTVTGGNVLFAHQLVDDALDAGTLAREHGVWRWAGGLGIAPRLQETVDARLGALSGAEREFFEFLSLGEPLALTTAERLCPRASIPALERRSLVAVERGAGDILVRLAHPMFGEILRATMPASLYRQVHHRLAEALASAPDRQQPADAIRLALLREAAGEDTDPGLLAEAAGNANLLLDYTLGERLARAAISGDDPFSAKLELSRSLLGQNRFEEAAAVVVPLVGSEPSDADRERLADIVLMVLGYALDRIDDALKIVEAIERNVNDHLALALIRCHRATMLAHGARFAEAAELGMAALDSVDDDSVRVRSLTSVGTSLVMAGRIDEALVLGEGALEPALRLRDRLPRAPTWAVVSRCTALFFAGRTQESLEFLDFALSLEEASGLSAQAVAQGKTYRGRLLLFQGRPNSASRVLLDAAVTLREAPIAPSWCIALTAEAFALRGNHKEARSAATEAIGLRRRGILAFDADERRALAWVDAQDGHTSSAIDQLWAAADLAAARTQRSLELIILEDLLRLGEQRAAVCIQEVARQVDGAWSRAIALHAGAALSKGGVDFESAAQAFGEIGASLVAAELWTSASAAYHRDGLAAKATKATRYSTELVQGCQGARTEPLGRPASRVPLSRRERETAVLAANGKTNAQIASDLSISERTVESHLYSVFSKLAITDRREIAERLQGEG